MITNFPNGVSSFGIPMAGNLPYTSGTYYFVNADTGSDGNDGLSPETPLKTIAEAYDRVKTNKDDVIVLSTNAVHTLTEMLTLSKNRVHFVGDCYGRAYGQRARIYMGVTTATTDVFAIKDLGVGNTFTGVKVWNANTLTQNIAAVGLGGEYPCWRNFEIYDSTRLDSDTHCELLLNSDSPQFFNGTIGSLADAVLGNKIRPAVRLANGLVGSGLVSRDVLFDGVKFWKKAGGTTTTMIKIASNSDLERVMELKNCLFAASIQGSTPAVAIDSATLSGSQVLLTGDTVAVNCTKIGTATGIINCTPARVATATIGIQGT